MPEGPELRLAANFINKVASKHLFGGKVIKSDLATKLTEVPFEVRLFVHLTESDILREFCDCDANLKSNRASLAQGLAIFTCGEAKQVNGWL